MCEYAWNAGGLYFYWFASCFDVFDPGFLVLCLLKRVRKREETDIMCIDIRWDIEKSLYH